MRRREGGGRGGKDAVLVGVVSVLFEGCGCGEKLIGSENERWRAEGGVREVGGERGVLLERSLSCRGEGGDRILERRRSRRTMAGIGGLLAGEEEFLISWNSCFSFVIFGLD